ncbi:MAG: hypothetical protein KME60_28145 [Cyanomargarita calcarea GSE-NOS-MK-12-04C]|uniref:Uncharacterized protein n=1 Tax=Cyanomargarita calcarea GSE-NOS-MK-12-04C TaxID=2839659 RepID=A0A951UVJ2_9CYAN|nr:hypothetical protein [Cyanomargarita calcarea GSE-NOS-MK-12-04C]
MLIPALDFISYSLGKAAINKAVTANIDSITVLALENVREFLLTFLGIN